MNYEAFIEFESIQREKLLNIEKIQNIIRNCFKKVRIIEIKKNFKIN
jgi:hypothetical protein